MSARAFGADQQEYLLIAERGRSSYRIACTRDSLPATLLAATELQRWVAQATGVELPVTAPVQGDEPAIILQSDQSLPRDSFTLQVLGKNLVITGHDSEGDARRIDYKAPVSCGTLYGVYEVLESYLGLRFYWPDDLGTIVPQHSEFRVPADLKVQQSPHFVYRRFWKGPGYVDHLDEDAARMWGRRLRLGASMPTNFYHSWRYILNVEEWAQRGHPEYAALVDGERRTWYDNGNKNGQVCVSDPQVQAIFVEAAKRSPDAAVSMSCNDGHSCHCQCASCQAWDSGRLCPDDGLSSGPAGKRDLSDRMVKFYNLVAERSGRLVGGYAYVEYSEVPANVKLHPNVTISLALNNAWLSGDPLQTARAERLYHAWGAYSPRTVAYDILYRKNLMQDLVAPLGEDVDRRIRLIADSGLAGAEFYIAPEMELGGPDAYVAAKLLWDPKADAGRIRQEYFRDLYGSASQDVQTFYQLAETQWRTIAADKRLKGRVYAAEQRRRMFLDVVGELQEQLHRAEKAAGTDPAVRERLARLRRALERMAE